MCVYNRFTPFEVSDIPNDFALRVWFWWLSVRLYVNTAETTQALSFFFMCYIVNLVNGWKMSEIQLLIDAIVDVQLTIHRPFVMKKLQTCMHACMQSIYIRILSFVIRVSRWTIHMSSLSSSFSQNKTKSKRNNRKIEEENNPQHKIAQFNGKWI